MPTDLPDRPSAPQPDGQFARSLPARLRLAFGIAAGFIAVLVMAGLMLGWAMYARDRSLTEHYARSAAHLGEQVEARFLLYRQLVDNSGRASLPSLPTELTRVDRCGPSTDSASAMLSPDGAFIDFPTGTSDLHCWRLNIQRLLAPDTAGQDAEVRSHTRRFEHVFLLAAQGGHKGDLLAAEEEHDNGLRALRLPQLVDSDTPGEPHMVSDLLVGTHHYRAFVQPVSEPAWAPCAVAPCVLPSHVDAALERVLAPAA